MGAFVFRGGTGLAIAMPTGATAVENGNPVKNTANLMVVPAASGDSVVGIAATDNALSVDGSYYVGVGDLFSGTLDSTGTFNGQVPLYIKVTTHLLGTAAGLSLATGKLSMGVLARNGVANDTNALFGFTPNIALFTTSP